MLFNIKIAGYLKELNAIKAQYWAFIAFFMFTY